LFPQLKDIASNKDGIEYVADRLIELAEQDELFVTDLFNPPNAGRAHLFAGMVITGAQFQDNRVNGYQEPPQALRDYMVTIEAVGHCGKPGCTPAECVHRAYYKTGHRKVGTRAGGGHTDTGENAFQVAEHDGTYAYPLGEERKGQVTLRVAWDMLRQCGESCVSSPPRQESTRWRVREVLPEALRPPPPKKRRGRPPKSASEATL
jgi:hypothetical protein